MMSDREAARRGLEPLGIFLGLAVAGCEPDEMGIGPVFAVPRLLSRMGLAMDDIDLWELNEAFAGQVLYCRDRLGIYPDELNVDGGSIAIGHPYGMSGARMAGTPADREGRRRRCQARAVVTMCIGGGHGCGRPVRDPLTRPSPGSGRGARKPSPRVGGEGWVRGKPQRLPRNSLGAGPWI